MTVYRTAITLMISLVFCGTVHAYDITWDYLDRTGWGVGAKSDNDEHGNIGVWDYFKAPEGSTTHTTYSGSLNWYASSTRWITGTTYPGSGNDGWFMIDYSYLHPGLASDPTIAFYAPETGVYDFSVTLWNSNTTPEAAQYGNGQYFYLQKFSTVLVSEYNAKQATSTLTKTNVSLNEGDAVYLRVNANDYEGYDIVTIQNFIITGHFTDPEPPVEPPAVPEPASAALIIAAITGLLFRKRSRI
ncbi:MAG: PEP-CTERM sorting domain-containing protein [Candidatus Auribacterota bacterium]